MSPANDQSSGGSSKFIGDESLFLDYDAKIFAYVNHDLMMEKNIEAQYFEDAIDGLDSYRSLNQIIKHEIE